MPLMKRTGISVVLKTGVMFATNREVHVAAL